MELRVNGDVEAIKTPTGYIPKYEDLKRLFNEVLSKDYSREQYNEQFKIRIPELLAKISRMEGIYTQKVPNTPKPLFKALEEQKKRLEELKRRKGEYVIPDDL
jgi:phosphoenolpyruvate carboxykinase (GTP)